MTQFVYCRLLLMLGLSTVVHRGLESAAMAHSDIFLTNVGGQVAVGGANDSESASPTFDLETQVFEAILVSGFPLPLVDYGRGEPGVFALPAGSPELPDGARALLGNAAVAFEASPVTVNGQTDSLFFWNGSGTIDFHPVATAQPNVTFSIDPTPFSDLTSDSGAFHLHPAYQLHSSGAGVPADGVYLASLSASATGLDDSQPFYLVMLVDQLLVDADAAEGLEATFEAGETFYEAVGKDFGFYEVAVEYVEANVAVPEPGSAVLGGLAVAGFLSVRRRHPRK
jgi:MYXO-CTERM domain-containing protein